MFKLVFKTNLKSQKVIQPESIVIVIILVFALFPYFTPLFLSNIIFTENKNLFLVKATKKRLYSLFLEIYPGCDCLESLAFNGNSAFC